MKTRKKTNSFALVLRLRARAATLLIALMCGVTGAWAWDGSGTQADPYLIKNTTEWDTFASEVNGGNTFSGKTFKLTQDISVKTMVGVSGHTFNGIFDGRGHTLTVDYNTSEQYAAPFHYTYGATIRNLKTAGTITTSGKNAGGVVGRHGTARLTMSNVTSSITINSSFSGSANHGGLVGYAINVTLEDCSFTGSLLGSGSKGCGGLVGWKTNSDNSSAIITNCLFNPASVTVSTTDSYTLVKPAEAGVVVTINNSYYTQSMGDTQEATDGSAMTAAQLVQNLGPSNWEVVDGKAVPKMLPVFSGGTGTSVTPYLIASTTDWNNFVSAVNGGETYSGTYFKMTANVGDVTPVSTWMTGTFSGTFDGDGKTLTVEYTNTTSGVKCAPFGSVASATIKNLRVAGSITTSQKFAAGISCYSSGTTNIENCRVSATIISSIEGDGTHGGVVAQVQGSMTLNVTGCAFTGKLLYTGAKATTSCGGFVGWTSGGTINFTNCLYAPASATGSEHAINEGSTFARGWNGTPTNSYYTQTMGTAQGKQMRTISAGTDVTSLAISGTGTVYDVNGITAYATGIKHNDVYYAGNGDEVGLTLSHADAAAGYTFTGYTVDNGSISGTTLTMTDADAVVSATYEPIPTYNLTANAGATGEYWATFYSNASNYQAPSGTKVFKVALSGMDITMTEIEGGIVNSGEGVVLKSTSNSITMTQTTSANTDTNPNSLQGTMTEIKTTGDNNYYVLNKKDAGVGFYKLSSTGTIGANKAYLVYTAGARECFLFSEATGISLTPNPSPEGEGSVYDLQGRRVSQPAKGLYIVRSAEGCLQGKNVKKYIKK